MNENEWDAHTHTNRKQKETWLPSWIHQLPPIKKGVNVRWIAHIIFIFFIIFINFFFFIISRNELIGRCYWKCACSTFNFICMHAIAQFSTFAFYAFNFWVFRRSFSIEKIYCFMQNWEKKNWIFIFADEFRN